MFLRSRTQPSLWSTAALRQSFQRRLVRRPFSRNEGTADQIKTAELQKTPHTPNQIATEVPHSKEPSLIDVPGPLWYHRMGPIKDFFSWFSRMQRKRPLTVTLATSLTTYFFGDILAQEIGRERYDGVRTLRMLSIGALASIPGYRWFMFLGSHWNYSSKLWSITIKVLIQQFFFAPIFNTYFFGMQAVLTGQPPSVVMHRIAQAVPESVVSSATFWPAVTALNFTVIARACSLCHVQSVACRRSCEQPRALPVRRSARSRPSISRCT